MVKAYANAEQAASLLKCLLSLTGPYTLLLLSVMLTSLYALVVTFNMLQVYV